MEKIWLKNYPQAVAPEISYGSYRTVVDVYQEACREHASLPAFTNMGVSLSYTELDRLATQFAAYLQCVVGLNKGDRIALQMPNLLQYPVALFGALKAGLIIVNTNPLYTTREMRHQFKDSGAKAIVILANFADKLQEVIKDTPIQTVIVTEVGDLFPTFKRVLVNSVLKYVKKMVPKFDLNFVSFREVLACGATMKFTPPNLTSEDTAFFQYTGGTTGVSKGAVLTHHNVVTNLLQMSEWMKPKLVPGQEVIITALPLYHIFSLTVNCLGLFKIGSNNVLITNPKDIPGFIKTLQESNPTVMTAVNTLLVALMEHPDFKTLKMPRLKLTVAGGMALKSAVAARWKKETGTPAIEGYGLTETSPIVCCNPLNDREVPGSVGMPVSSTEIKLVDEKDQEVELGQEGELCVRGHQVMKGYYNAPEETAKVFLPDGWLRTGDIAVVDPSGFVRLVDRKKDMILVSGFNVYPNEVEEVLVKHPKVVDAAAIGIEDERAGEVVKAFVISRDPSLTEAELIAFAKESLTNYKVPRHIEFRTELPKSNVGKILRRPLKEEERAKRAAQAKK